MDFEPVDNEGVPGDNLARFAVGASACPPLLSQRRERVMVDAFIDGVVPWLAIVDTVSAVVRPGIKGVAGPLEGIFRPRRVGATSSRTNIGRPVEGDQ